MDYNIPLFDLNYDEQEEKAVVDVLQSKWISTGPRSSELEDMFCDYFNVGHAVSLTNCTVALHLAMEVLNIQKGNEVICPSLTFVATANAIKYVGAIPVFADVKGEDDLTIDPEQIRKLITENTKAIIVMHYAGFSCEMDEILAIAEEHNLKVIEDACHGPLSEYKGKKLGTIGDVGCFSFFSNKNLSTGEGGMLLTNNPDLAEKAKLLRSHGMTTMSYNRAKGHSTSYDVVALGYNYRMDDIRASLGIVQLKKLRADLEKRKKVRFAYERELKSVKNITVPFKNHPYFSSNYIFPVILTKEVEKNRDEIRNLLHKSGIQTSIHYPPVHLFDIYYDEKDEGLSKTESVYNRLITLPMYGNLSEEQVEYICKKLKEYAV
ncbi:DegT/DnrJ/EryC1/StrS family aminotransferase [Salegentibacter sp. UBA1130]|uniref:DegT/DnrJ/EryC1/StrS family aminotransferase n=1 Tax=Salegentibacter sp. UBA1130 TaxID=1947451 RepID=UPI00257AD2BF|nr:DegT/DnrJ/EryC1/StrS family aminotransferase [Salegentibacter sp. UBA1130]